jgi:hypothetical protein
MIVWSGPRPVLRAVYTLEADETTSIDEDEDEDEDVGVVLREYDVRYIVVVMRDPCLDN